jgi:hypothetical protein
LRAKLEWQVVDMPLPYAVPEIQDNPEGWGPCSVPDHLKDVPFAPFSKGDKLGKAADWTQQAYQKFPGVCPCAAAPAPAAAAQVDAAQPGSRLRTLLLLFHAHHEPISCMQVATRPTQPTQCSSSSTTRRYACAPAATPTAAAAAAFA